MYINETGEEVAYTAQVFVTQHSIGLFFGVRL